VPMLLAGDEFGRTQKGNNNAYCQDNEMAWLDWESADRDLLEYTRRLIDMRRRHRVFRRRRWFQGRPIHGSDVTDVGWFRPEDSFAPRAEVGVEGLSLVVLRRAD